MNPTDHLDDELPTLDEYLTGRGWRLVRIDKARGADVGIYERDGLTLRASEALMRDWEEPEATK